MMFNSDIKMAIESIRCSRLQSLLTMLGVIVGIVSVVTIVSLGEGVKRDIVGQINHLGPDLITIKPGKIVTRDQQGELSNVNIFGALSNSGSLSDSDISTIQKAQGVKQAIPFAVVSGNVSFNNKPYTRGFVVGTNSGMPEMLNQKVEFGSFFGNQDNEFKGAIIGKDVAEELFEEPVPMGRSFQIREQTFVVRGIFEEFDSSPLAPYSDYNHAIFIPYSTAKQISNGQLQVQQVLAKPNDQSQVSVVIDNIDAALRATHNNQEDFTVLQQRDTLAVANKVLDVLTAVISSIAAISLIVGGVGIMNIMLVSVSERTHEIGVRKAIGATNRQISNQFLIEATILSLTGGLIGIILSFIANYFIRLFTELHPFITIEIMVLAVGVSAIVGIFFGVAPAVKAARKDPIDALRRV